MANERNTSQEGADLEQAAREYTNKVWLNFDKEYENLISNKGHEGLFPKDLLIWEVIHKAYEKGAEWQKQRLIDKACTNLRFFFKAIDEDYDCQKFIDWFKKEMEEQQ